MRNSISREKIDKAKEIARNCSPGSLIVFDRNGGEVFYRDVHSKEEIPTDFTEEHVDIAHHAFPPQDPAHIEWDRRTSEATGGNFDVYTVKGR